MLVCPKDSKKGTGFFLAGHKVVATNAHVVGSCSASELKATNAMGEQLEFTRLVTDANRDLALLCPENSLSGGLILASNEDPPVETEIETWGYPLAYQGYAPILSRGYVAGYLDKQHAQPNGQIGAPVKHLIVNGALNPGNSGGPLIDRSNGKVIGVVVEKWGLFSPLAEIVIQDLEHPSVILSSGVSYRDANGRQIGLSQQEALAAVLKEFYGMSQVMIGEAISVQELNAFVKENQGKLGCGN